MNRPQKKKTITIECGVTVVLIAHQESIDFSIVAVIITIEHEDQIN